MVLFVQHFNVVTVCMALLLKGHDICIQALTHLCGSKKRTAILLQQPNIMLYIEHIFRKNSFFYQPVKRNGEGVYEHMAPRYNYDFTGKNNRNYNKYF